MRTRVTNRGLILLADDDDFVLRMMQSALNLHGYNVVTARNGEEAIRLFDIHRKNLDLALIDIVMPRVSGDIVISEITRVFPWLPVIAMSGTKVIASSNTFELGSNRAFVNKPYPLEVMLHLVRTLIRPASPTH